VSRPACAPTTTAGFPSMNSSFVFNHGSLSVQTQHLDFFILFSIEAMTAGAP